MHHACIVGVVPAVEVVPVVSCQWSLMVIVDVVVDVVLVMVRNSDDIGVFSYDSLLDIYPRKGISYPLRFF